MSTTPPPSDHTVVLPISSVFSALIMPLLLGSRTAGLSLFVSMKIMLEISFEIHDFDILI